MYNSVQRYRMRQRYRYRTNPESSDRGTMGGGGCHTEETPQPLRAEHNTQPHSAQAMNDRLHFFF